MSRSLIFKSITAGAGLPPRPPAGPPAGRSRPVLEGVGLTNPGVQSLLALTIGTRELPALARSLMMSMEGKLAGLRRDKGSLANWTKKSRSYCFLPSVLIGDHCSEKSKLKIQEISDQCFNTKKAENEWWKKWWARQYFFERSRQVVAKIKFSREISKVDL